MRGMTFLILKPYTSTLIFRVGVDRCTHSDLESPAHILSGKGTRTCRSPKSSSQEDDPNLVACVRYLPPLLVEKGKTVAEGAVPKIAKDYCILRFEMRHSFHFFRHLEK